MKFDTNTIWGIVFFLFGSLLLSINQMYAILLFANPLSEILFVLICFAIITLGISMVLFEEFWTESFIGFLAIVFTILILNAALLLGDSFTVFRYDSTDYFALFKYAIYFPEIPDKVALLLIAIAPPLGILLWWAISRDDLKDWYGLGMFALIVFSETILFTATKGMNIFIV